MTILDRRESKEAQNFNVKPAIRHTRERRHRIDPLVILGAATVALVAASTIANGLKFGNWNPIYVPTVLSR